MQVAYGAARVGRTAAEAREQQSQRPGQGRDHGDRRRDPQPLTVVEPLLDALDRGSFGVDDVPNRVSIRAVVRPRSDSRIALYSTRW